MKSLFLVLTLMVGSWTASAMAAKKSKPEPRKPSATATVSTVDIDNAGLSAATKIMIEVYSRMGIQLNVVQLPARRALPDANAGKYDGELYRVAAVAKEYPNLRMVPTSIGDIEFVAYGRKETAVKIENWESLRPYRLGAQLGIKFIEYKTKGMNINFVSRSDQLLYLLHHNRIDVALMDRATMLQTMKQMRNTPDRKIVGEIEELKQLERLPLYHYVHQKNESWIPEIDANIQALIKEGFLKKTWDELLPKLAP